MINGIYKYEDKEAIMNYGRVILKVSETAKAYYFQLIENTMRYSPAHIDMMFAKSDSVRINKERTSHAMNLGEDYFVIYPFRAGIPFLFELVKENDNDE